MRVLDLLEIKSVNLLVYIEYRPIMDLKQIIINEKF